MLSSSITSKYTNIDTLQIFLIYFKTSKSISIGVFSTQNKGTTHKTQQSKFILSLVVMRYVTHLFMLKHIYF